MYATPNICTVGWIDFVLFFEFYEKSRVGGSPGYNLANYQIFMILVQKPTRVTPFKVHIIQKIQGGKKKIFGKMLPLMSSLYSKKSNLK